MKIYEEEQLNQKAIELREGLVKKFAENTEYRCHICGEILELPIDEENTLDMLMDEMVEEAIESFGMEANLEEFDLCCDTCYKDLMLNRYGSDLIEALREMELLEAEEESEEIAGNEKNS